MLCLSCGVTLQRNVDLCDGCGEKSLDQITYSLAQHCHNSTGSRPKGIGLYRCSPDFDTTIIWFVKKLAFLISFWPQSCLLQDYWFREFYMLAADIHRLGTHHLRILVLQQTNMGWPAAEVQHAMDAWRGGSTEIKDNSGGQNYIYTCNFTHRFQQAEKTYASCFTNKDVPLLPFTLQHIIMEYVPLCQCKCKLINDSRLQKIPFIVGCDIVACNTHIACTCCIGVKCISICCGGTHTCGLCTRDCKRCDTRVCLKLCSSTCSECHYTACKQCIRRCEMDKCGALICNKCFSNLAQCTLCERKVCMYDRTMCSGCSQTVCRNCWRKCALCSSPGSRMCFTCGISCSYCGDFVCKEHIGIDCKDCGRRFCQQCDDAPHHQCKKKTCILGLKNKQ